MPSDLITTNPAPPMLLPPVLMPRQHRSWIPRRVLVTRDAMQWAHGRAIAERASELGSEVLELKGNRVVLPAATDRSAYASAKSTLAVVTASRSVRRPQPIPPSADWQFHIAQGCPAHCQYCYLAGSLSGPPIVRAYANLPEILGELCSAAGRGTVTSASATRRDEGTTFEMSCYTDPLGIEHLTRSLAECIRWFGAWDDADTPVQLRWTTKFSAVEPLLSLPHGGRTRVRFSVAAPDPAGRFESGTATVAARLDAMRKLALAGYPVGLTIAPIMPLDGWREQYTALFQSIRTVLDGVPAIDLTAEMITHRFTGKSRGVLLNWYPNTRVDLDLGRRDQKRTRMGTLKYVYPAPLMREMRTWFHEALADILPQAVA